ncbi:MAG: Flp pilus assembly protein CpaB [Pseudomonadota bacterium]
MKNARALTMLLLAIALGLCAVVLASRWLLQQAGTGSTRIVVAAADVNLGQRLAPEMLTQADWPAGSVPAGALTEPAALGGRVLKSSLLRGEPLTEAKLAPLGTLGGLSAVIAEGKRAITVRVNDVIGVAGFALPGNFVDIIVNTERDGAPAGQPGKERFISKIVLERILVLAVAQEVNRDDTKPRVVNAVTLEVTPEQAENLDLARSVGTLSLALRNQVDPKPGTTAGATKVSLLNEAPAPPVTPAPAPLLMSPWPAMTMHAPRAPRPQPAPPKPAGPALAGPLRHCSGVINGLGSGTECF